MVVGCPTLRASEPAAATRLLELEEARQLPVDLRGLDVVDLSRPAARPAVDERLFVLPRLAAETERHILIVTIGL